MPRRYYEYPPEFQVLNVMSTAGASILAVGYLLPLIYLLLSLKVGPIAGPNPWGATGLEWTDRQPAADRTTSRRRRSSPAAPTTTSCRSTPTSSAKCRSTAVV